MADQQQSSGMDCCGCPPPPQCCPPPSCCIPPPCRFDDAPVASQARKQLRFDANVFETYQAKQRQTKHAARNVYKPLDDDCCGGPPCGVCGPPPCCCQPCQPPQCCGGPCSSCSRYDDDSSEVQSKSQILRPEDLPAGALIAIGGETYISTGKLSSAMSSAKDAAMESDAADASKQQQKFARYDDDCGCPSCCPPPCCPPCPMGPPQAAGCSLPAPCCCEASRANQARSQQQQRQQTQQQQNMSSYFNDAYSTAHHRPQRSVFSYRQAGPMKARRTARRTPY